MKLSELVTEVATELQYNPTATSYIDSVTRTINAVYEEICTSQRWHFLEKIAEIEIKPTAESSGTFFWLHFCTYVLADIPGDFIGCTLVYEPPGESVREFTVVNQETTTPLNGRIYFEPDLVLAGALPAPLKIKYTNYLLPADCDSVEGVVYRTEKLDVIEVTRSREKRLALDLNRTGLPQVFFEEDTRTVKGIDQPCAGAVTALTGTFGATGVYRWFYTLNQHGAESSPSTIITGTIAALTDKFTLSDMEDTRHLWEDDTAPHDSTNQEPGIYKTIYREFNGSGIFYPIVVDPIWDDVTTFVDTGFAVDVTKPFEYTSGRRSIRLYPLADKAGTLELRYKFRPQRLVRDADTPVLPPEFHRMLVYRTVAILASQHDGEALARVHTKLADKMMERMRRRYLGGNAATFRQRQYWNDVYKRVIQPDISWNG